MAATMVDRARQLRPFPSQARWRDAGAGAVGAAIGAAAAGTDLGAIGVAAVAGALLVASLESTRVRQVLTEVQRPA
jgi:CBS-domain-containing membrane protein